MLPRQAEALLVVLGLRPPAYTHEPAPEGSSSASTSSSRRASAPGTPLRNVLELAEFEGRPKLDRYAEPLLLAQYQGLLGDSPDYLYDMFLLDAGESAEVSWPWVKERREVATEAAGWKPESE